MGVSIDCSLATGKGTGIYTFKAHGQIYHRLDQLMPGAKGPRHMQLYSYDTDETMHHRMKRSPHLDANVICTLLNIMQHNPYVQAFKSLITLTNLDCYAIELNTSISVDQRRYNAPAMEQVAAIWFDGNDPQQRFERSIVIYGKENQPHYIRPYHGCYDPLAYPMFNPNGEIGWEVKKILYQDSPPSKPKRKYTKRVQKGSSICYLHISNKQFILQNLNNNQLQTSYFYTYIFIFYYIGPMLVEINDVSETNVHEEGYFLSKRILPI
jgi:hypothetical protein